jgi:DNA-repair protein XRCC1
VIKLEKPYQITQIDIGNEYSSTIEVLVANSLESTPKFHELLFATSFMLLPESRNGLNPNRVRIFESNVFVQPVAEKKWDLVKVLCQQNFVSHKQFGIAFINIHTNDKVEEKKCETLSTAKPTVAIKSEKKESLSSQYHQKAYQNSKPVKTIGSFKFRDSSTDEEDEETSPFKKWKDKKANVNVTPSNNKLLSTTSSSKITSDSPSFSKLSLKEQIQAKLESENSSRKRIRMLNDSSSEDEKPKPKQDRNRLKGLMYESDDDAPNDKLQKKIDMDKEMKVKMENSPKLSSNFTPKDSSSSSGKIASASKNISQSSSSSTCKSDVVKSPKIHHKKTLKIKEVKYKKFEKLLEGVVFVLSGYQNPERGIIRQKALDMGATYKTDWENSCTHLM